MSRTTRKRLAGATLHLDAAIAYDADGHFYRPDTLNY
jgi:hypothetical protein